MKKIKYEKPIVRRLGYDSEVVAGICNTGPGFASGCGKGNKAETCTQGTTVAPVICLQGGAPSS
jgi:hypothetical protein